MITDHMSTTITHSSAENDECDDFPIVAVRNKSANRSTSLSDGQFSACSSLDGSSASKSDHTIIIPSHWSQQTQSVIDEKKLNPKARNDIIRTLVTLAVSQHGMNPTRNQVENICRELVLKYPFMRDDLGTGYVSYNCRYC